MGPAARMKPATEGDGGAHRFVFGKGGEDFGEVDVQLQVVTEPVPVFGRNGFGVDGVSVLPQADPVGADDSLPNIVDSSPAKGLAGTERRVQVIMLDLEFNGF